ncbi:MAG: GNAT family N-acetyltransferase [Fimbriimonadaceae bacterium]|nr:GNAT family N-acetyltransferase [Fimbriimonadaceae bacterium]
MQLRFDWVTDGASEEFAAFAELYEASFPDDEREPTHKFAEWIKPDVGEGQRDPNYLLAAFDGDEFLGFLFYSFYRQPCFAFFVYIAVNLNARGKGVASALFQEGERHCQQLAKQLGSEFLAVVGEVERIEDALDESDRERRVLRLKLFDKLGLSILSSGYTQPALTDDSEPVPLNLMWKPASLKANRREIALAFYRLVFELDEDHEYVQQTLKELRA